MAVYWYQVCYHSMKDNIIRSIVTTGGMDNQVVVWDTAVFQEERKQKNASREG